MSIVLCLGYGLSVVHKLLAQLFLLCCGIPFIPVQQAFSIALADRAWARARWLSLGLDVGVATGVCHVHDPICTVLSASLATPRSMEAAASILFFPEVFLCQGVGIIQWLSKKDFWEEE